MRFCRFLRRDGLDSIGVWTEQGVVPLEYVDATLPPRIDQLMSVEDQLAKRLKKLDSIRPLQRMPRLLPPIDRCEKVICIGLNYRDHAIETGMAIPSEPIVFSKFPSALIGPDEPIRLPAVSQQVDYEAELVVVVGREARHIPESRAMDYVFGYCCGHDVSARDWQIGRPGGQWLLGKSFDTFAPVGPTLVHKSLVPDPSNLTVSMRINGELMQQSTTAQLIFPIPYLLSFLSRMMTLRPGDLIFTGTPPGVGVARKPQRFLKPGDVCEVSIDGVGTLRNECVAESIEVASDGND
jgi:2-keto-4-pentenoate hydratase/2-oxohepta-3-ene-1,7-dioic acid hydratase in catechol pathway